MKWPVGVVLAAALVAQSPPRVKFHIEPQLPAIAREAGVEGTVLVSLEVEDGAPSGVRVVKGMGWGLDEAAVKCVEQWHFESAPKMPVTVEVNFRYVSQTGRALLRPGAMTFAIAPDVQAPQVLEYVAPALTDVRAGKGSGGVAFTVTSAGTVEDARVIQSAGKGADADFLKAMQNWRFAPAISENKAVEAKATVRFEVKP